MGRPDSLHQFVIVVNFIFHVLLLVLRIAPRITDLDRIVRVLVQENADRVVQAVKQGDALGFLPIHDRQTIVEQGHVGIAYPLAEHPFERMLPAAKVVLQIKRFLRCRSLVRRLVSFVAIVDQDNIELVLDLDVADLPLHQKNVLQVDDFETVLVRILEIVVVGNPGALGAPVIERIVAAGLTLAFVGEVGLSSQGLDGLIQNRARLARIVGVVQVDGGLRGAGWSECGLGAAKRG